MYFVGFEKLSLTLAIHRIGGNQNSKTLLTIYELGSKITRNSVFHCNLSPTGDIWQSKTLFMMIFCLHPSIVFTLSIAAYTVCCRPELILSLEGNLKTS